MSLLHGFGTQLATGLFKDRAAVRFWIEDGITLELELDQPFSLN